MSLPLAHHLLHKPPVTVQINNRPPVPHPNYKHLHSPSHLNPTLFTRLQMLQLEDCSLPSLHTGHQPLNLQILATHIVLHLLHVHQEHTTEITRINVLQMLLLLRSVLLVQRTRHHRSTRHRFEFQRNTVIPRRLVYILTQSHYRLKYMQKLLLTQQLPLLYPILRRLIIRQKIFLIYRRQIRIVKMVGNLLLRVDIPLLLINLLQLTLSLRTRQLLSHIFLP